MVWFWVFRSTFCFKAVYPFFIKSYYPFLSCVMSSSFSRLQLTVQSPPPFWLSSCSNSQKFQETFTPLEWNCLGSSPLYHSHCCVTSGERLESFLASVFPSEKEEENINFIGFLWRLNSLLNFSTGRKRGH